MIINILRKFTPSFLINWYHFLLPALGAFLYGFPSKKMIIVGVTGTSGKSTVVGLTTKILEEAGHKIASLSSIKFKVGDREQPNTLKMTMPGRLGLQKFLRDALDAGCQYVVLEVTSEGIKQHRHRFIDFDVAVFTNLTPEHIEAHGSFEKYREAKGKLFQATKNIHVINLDDENTNYFLQFEAITKFAYKTARGPSSGRFGRDRVSDSSDWKTVEAKDIKEFEKDINFGVQNTCFNLNLLGKFNVYNALAAICVGLSQGIDLKTCKSALERIEVIPGRMEMVIEKPFKVFVDYAITPNALEKVYQTLTTNNYQLKTGRLICVLGSCGGGRDKWKRPILGKLAAKYCNQIIVTNEDPYDEDPNQILSMIKSGITKSKFPISNFYEILDRREAIKKALNLARSSDVVVITGKGCEPWMCVEKGKKIPWDDRKIVKEELRKLKI